MNLNCRGIETILTTVHIKTILGLYLTPNGDVTISLGLAIDLPTLVGMNAMA